MNNGTWQQSSSPSKPAKMQKEIVCSPVLLWIVIGVKSLNCSNTDLGKIL